MTEKAFKAVAEVDIDKGVFKYVQIRVYRDDGEETREEKDLVRGYTFAEYHADVYDRTEAEVTEAGLDCECLGGGRIEHSEERRYIKVYGYSMGFGKANHERSVAILKRAFPDYTIEWSDEGY
jgi:phosphohistidine phosphatase